MGGPDHPSGPLDLCSRLMLLRGGMGGPGQQGHVACFQEGNVHLLRPTAHPASSGVPGFALGHPLSFAHRAGTPGFLWPPEWGQLGGISQSLLEQWLPPACLLRLGRAEGGGREGGRGERRKGKKVGRPTAELCLHPSLRGGPCGVGRARSKERPSSLCAPPFSSPPPPRGPINRPSPGCGSALGGRQTPGSGLKPSPLPAWPASSRRRSFGGQWWPSSWP